MTAGTHSRGGGPGDAFKVPAAEQRELVAIVESTKPEIVVGSNAKTK